MLVSASTGQTEIEIAPIISAFVANFDFIPRHRRLSLFKVLLETLGPDQHLPTALFLFADKGCQANEKSKAAVTEFGADLVNSFPLSTRLTVQLFQIKLIEGN
jgi:U3 small nucleolar RNA-associated protein 10